MIRPTLVSALALALALPARTESQQVVDLPARDRALSPTAPLLAAVGKFDGADWETFGEIADVEFDGAGNLYVFDAQKTRVVVVDPAGKLVRMFGKRGDGPGELSAPTALVVLPDGTAVIADMGHRSFVLFDSEGEFARSVPMGGDEGLTVLGELFSDGRGGLLSAGRLSVMFSRAAGPGQGPVGPPREQPIVHFSLEGRGGQQLLRQGWQPPHEEGKPVQLGTPGAGAMMFRGPEDVAFEPRLFSGALPDGGLAFSDSSAYAIKIMGPDGAIRRVLRRPIEPRRVTGGIQDAERERRLAELEEGGGPQMRIVTRGPGGGPAQQISPEQIKQMRRTQIEQMTFYPEVPVVTDVATGWSGKIWVQRRGRDVYEPGPIDILTATGDYLGTWDSKGLELPRAFGPGGRVAYVVRDELDIPRVEVRQLPTELR